jgi:hypothetical protein
VKEGQLALVSSIPELDREPFFSVLRR